jgi:hypothetical protein
MTMMFTMFSDDFFHSLSSYPPSLLPSFSPSLFPFFMTHLISVIHEDDENYEFSGYPDGMYDEEDEIGTGYLDDDFEEKNASKRDRDRNAYDDKDDLEMVRYALIRTSTPS